MAKTVMRYRIKSRRRSDGSEHIIFTSMTLKQQQTSMELLLRHKDLNDDLEYITESYFETTSDGE